MRGQRTGVSRGTYPPGGGLAVRAATDDESVLSEVSPCFRFCPLSGRGVLKSRPPAPKAGALPLSYIPRRWEGLATLKTRRRVASV